MFGGLISWLMENMLYFALHMDSSTVFPKPLSAKEEEEAFKRMAEGDSSARGKLIEHNLRLVAHVVKKYYTTAADSEELISIGTVGLIKAVNTFNKSKSTRFATYAAKCIDNEVLMFFRSAKKSARDVYLDDPVDTDKDGNSMSLMDIISEDDNMVDKIDTMIKTRQLYGFVESCLDDREKQIIRLRYGLYGTMPMTQREVANKLNISRSYVSRIEKKALEKLRDRYEK
ncbi:MAG: RNA polymerase sporulation sigma factor SigK [Oscillospiraceae bacterium]|nr:RNA polymerase sporulation sigma factor SigK [Oscillospiraceae bacterium]